MDISRIGLMFDNTDPENPVALEGWHINTLQPIPNAEAFLVTVNSPSFGFLGVPQEQVLYYVFESEEQAESYLPQVGEV